MLRELVHVVRILHLIIYINNGGLCEGHSQADGGTAPSLTEGVQHDQVGILLKFQTQGTFCREVTVCLVNNDESFETVNHLDDLFTLDVVSCRVVRRTDPDYLGVVIAGS